MNKVEIAEKEIVRKEIIKMCAMTDPLGAATEVIHSALKKSGYEITKEQVAVQMNYLEGKGLIRLKTVGNKRLNIERTIANITPAGTDYLEGNAPSIAGVSEYDE